MAADIDLQMDAIPGRLAKMCQISQHSEEDYNLERSKSSSPILSYQSTSVILWPEHH